MCAVTLGDNMVTKELHSHHELNTGVDTCSVVPVVMVTTHLVEFVVMSNEFEISQHESVFYFCHVIVTIQWILVWLKLLGEKSCNRLLAALVSKGQLIKLFSLFNHALYLLLNLLLLLLMKLQFHNYNISVWGYSCSVLKKYCLSFVLNLKIYSQQSIFC